MRQEKSKEELQRELDELRSQLAESQRELVFTRDVLESLAEGLMLAQISDGQIIYTNSRFDKMFGYEKGELIGKIVNILNAPTEESPEDVVGRIVHSLTNTGTWRGEVCNIKKDGSHFWTRAFVSPYSHPTYGEVWVTLQEDISEAKQAQEELEAKDKIVRQTQKLEAVGTLAGGIAHDFNNVLQGIAMGMELSKMSLESSHPLQQTLSDTTSFVDRGTRLVRQILSFSRNEEQKFTTVDLVAQLKDAVRMLQSTIPATVEFETSLGEEPIYIKGNTTQLHQIVVNLCTNGAHAMKEKGGKLSVDLATVSIDEEKSALLNLKRGDYVQLLVKDEGKGMPENILERVLEPFFTTKKVGEGTGLGLSVVHGIVKAHSGKITFQSKVDQGTSVEVLFPHVKEAPKKHKEVALQDCHGSEHIMIVDDEPLVRSMLETSLKQLGYQVSQFGDGISALEQLRLTPNGFDFILCDQTMPKMMGDKFAKEAIAVNPKLPIVLVTGFSHSHFHEQAKEIGVAEILTKPCTAQKLGMVIRQILDGRTID